MEGKDHLSINKNSTEEEESLLLNRLIALKSKFLNFFLDFTKQFFLNIFMFYITFLVY